MQTLAQELRFIFPALPLFNLAIGVGMSKAVAALSPASAAGKKDDSSSSGDGGGGVGDVDDDGGIGGRTRSKAR